MSVLEKIISKRAFKPIEIKEWAELGSFTLRRLTVGDMALYRKHSAAHGMAAWLLVLLGDATGARVAQESELAKLEEIDRELATRIVLEGIEYNGLNDSADEAKKNSNQTGSSTSSSSSPSN